MLENFSPQPTEITRYELVFRLEDVCSSAFRFDCDEHGNVYQNGLPELALYNLRSCLKGEVDGWSVSPGVVTYYTQSYVEDGGGTL